MTVGATAAQEAPCDDFDAALEAAREAVAAYWGDREPHLLHTVIEGSRAARACATAAREHAQSYNYETWALVELNRHAEADRLFEDFGRLVPAAQDSTIWATMHFRHAYTLHLLGRYADSQRAYARALRYGEALPLDRRIRLYIRHAIDFAHLAAYGEALERLGFVEHLLREQGASLPAGEHDALLGQALLHRADVLKLRSSERAASRSDDLDRVVAVARQALSLLGGSEYEMVRDRILSLLVLADALHAMGRTDAALAHYRSAVQAADAHGEVWLRAEAWSDLGEHFLALDEPEAALPPLRHALDLWLAEKDNIKVQHAYVHLGRVYEQQGRMDEAESAYLEAIARVEQHRSSLGAIDLAAAAFADWQTPYRRLVGLHLRTEQPREAFALLEQTRARHLNDLRRGSQDLIHLDAAERARMDSLDAVIERLRAELATAPDPSGLLHAQLSEAEAERYGPGTVSSDYAPPSLSDVQRTLSQRGQTLLTYFLGEPSYAFVVTPDAFRAVRLDVTEAAVDSLVEAVSPLWRSEAAAPTRQSAEFDVGALHALYRAFFEPVRDLIPPGTPLVVVPEGRLRQVPFAMLLEAPTPRFQYASAPFLLRRHPIATDLAAALLTDTTTASDGHRLDLLAFGRSHFSFPASPSPGGETALPDLPVVRDELRALRSLFRQGVIALDAEASESALNRHLPEARVVHLASHAEVDTQRPLYSHIELWPDAAEDGRLYLYELAGRHLPADLVVLSGCSTARGQVLAGEGMVGLHYGFRAAGVGASVGTLWHVDDVASGMLMERFYVHLRDGLPKDHALQQAQLDYLASVGGLRASPFYWAAPVLYGSPAPVLWSTHPGLSTVAWMGLGGLLVLLALALPRLGRRV